MKDQLPDSTVLIAILATLILIFSLIFSTRAPNLELQQDIEWRGSQIESSENIQI